MNLQIYDFDASVNVPRLAAYDQARPTGYTPCSLHRLHGGTTCFASLGDALAEQSALVSLMSKLIDSSSLDYVASGSNRSVLR
jgi:hypothetical protein